jgi:O-antigen/teichoic acid export membrane protein
MSTLRSRVAKGAVWTIGLRFAEKVIGLVNTLFLARLLVPADFGIVAMGASAVFVIGALTDFSFTQTLIQRPEIDDRDYDSAWTLNLILGLIAASALTLAIPATTRFYGEPRVEHVLWALVITTVLGGLRNYGMVMHERRMNFRPVIVLALTRRLASFAVTLALAFYLRSYWALVAGMVTGVVVEIGLGYVLSSFRPKLSLARARELLSFSGWLLLNNVVGVLSARGQDFVIGNRLGASPLGSYSVANELATIPTTEVILPLMRAVYPGYVGMRENRGQLAYGFVTVFGVVAAIILPAAVGLICVAEPAVAVILGAKWLGVTELVKVLCVLALIQVFQTSTNPVYFTLGHPRIVTGLNSLYLLVGLPLFAYLLSRLPLQSAVWALIAAAVLVLTVNLVLLGKHLGIGVLSIVSPLLRPILATVLMAAVVSFAKTVLWHPGSVYFEIAVLVALIGLGGAAYSGGLYVLWRLGGSPNGPEKQLLDLATRALRKA